MGSKDDIYVAVACFDLIHDRLLLHHAAAEHRQHLRVLFLVTLELSQVTVHLEICILTHGTGIVKHKICFLLICLLVADHLQNAKNLLGISRIHLAAEGCHTRSQRSAKLTLLILHPKLQLTDEIILALRLFLRRCHGHVHRLNDFCHFYSVHRFCTPFLNSLSAPKGIYNL